MTSRICHTIVPMITALRLGLQQTKVMEHVERFSAHPEKYLDNKGLVVAHFHRMARAWYRATHLSKNMVEATQFPRF